MSITGPEPGQPTKVGVALVDVLTGLHATVGILAALRHRDATGEGQQLEVSLLTSLLSGLVNQSGAVIGAGVVPGIMGNAHPSIAPYSSFHTADRDIVIAVGNDRQFASLCGLLERPDLAADPRFAGNPQRVATGPNSKPNSTARCRPARPHSGSSCAPARTSRPGRSTTSQKPLNSPADWDCNRWSRSTADPRSPTRSVLPHAGDLPQAAARSAA